jgi:adenylate cyclase
VPADPVERRLAAILSADAVGYSRLMAEDEVAAVRAVQGCRDEMDRQIREHRGRVVDSPGDNLLAEFRSATDAVTCAVAIQETLGHQPEPRLEYRIGVHLGEVMVEEERIYGDGVNIAARLEGLADTGGVCVSHAVYEQLRNKSDVALSDLGPQRVKNLPEPIRAWRVRVDAPASPAPAAAQPPGDERPSIAVLPFSNMSGDPEQEYFSDGISEDLITDLSKLSGLTVIARNSSFTYKGRAVRVDRVGRDLGVRYVLEGSVRKAGDRVRITAQLVDARSGGHLWAERYDGQLEDVFRLQDEVTGRIVAALRVELTEKERERVEHVPTESADAWDYYLRGRAYLLSDLRENVLRARERFERAIELDPGFGAAFAELSRAFMASYLLSWKDEPDAGERALELAEKGVSLAPNDPATLRSLSFARSFLGPLDTALEVASRAIELAPNDAEVHQDLAHALMMSNRFDEAIESCRRAALLDPRHWRPLFTQGQCLVLTKRYAEAVDCLRRVIHDRPDFLVGHLFLAAAYSRLGQKDRALEEAAEVRRINPDYSIGETRRRIPALQSTEIFDELNAIVADLGLG